MKQNLKDRYFRVFQPGNVRMFDQIIFVKIIEMQHDAERQRWQKDEDAFYRAMAGRAPDYLRRAWRCLRTALRSEKKKDRQLPAGPSCNDLCVRSDQAARS